MRAMQLFIRSLPIAALLACVFSPAAAYGTWPGKPGRVAYWSNDPADPYGPRVHTVRPDGTGDRVILTGLGWQAFAWSPNGRELVYVNDTIGRVRADGTHGRSIRSSGWEEPGREEPDLLSPAWGPKGDRLVFTASSTIRGSSGAETPPGRISWIWSVNRDGTHLRKLVRGREAVWSRSGAHIRFIDEDYDIVEIKPNGRGRRVLARNSLYTRSLDLSPDGNRLVYETGSEAEPTFRTLNVRNGARTKVTVGKRGYVFGGVVWAPGGKRLAYIYPVENQLYERYQLRTIRPDGRGGSRHVLTFSQNPIVSDIAWQTR
jgi:Tol biopolymer transport system component